MLEIADIRKDFQILSQKVNGKPLIYFDNAATSQRPAAVIDKIREYSVKVNSNIHRGSHFLAIKTTEAFEESRETVRKFINAKETSEIIFTHGTTESLNLIASSFGDAFLSEGDEVIVSEMEHHSNIVPWQMICEKKGATIMILPFDEKGELQVDFLEGLITDKTKLIAITHVSNVLGTINPIKEIIRIAHKKGVPVSVDGAQAAPHIVIDVQALDCDFYSFSGHKIYGPTGIGVMYGKREWLEKMPPFLGGGEMISKVTFAKTTYNVLPFKFEAGTPNYVGAIGMAEAIRYLETIGRRELARYEDDLSSYATNRVKQVEGLRIYGEAAHKTGVISFNIDGIHPFDLGTLLDQMGIAVRTGRLCADPVMDHFGCESMLRASFAFYNTLEEIDTFHDALIRLKTMF